MVRASAGLSSDSAGTVPGSSTSRRLSQAVATKSGRSSAPTNTRERVDVPRAEFNIVFMFGSLEAQTQVHEDAGGRRQNGLITRCGLPGGTNFRIPRDHAAIGDRDADRAVTRRVPAVLRGPQHGYVAHSDAERTRIRTEATYDPAGQVIGRSDFTQAKKTRLVGAGCIVLEDAGRLQDRIVPQQHGG